ncbi:hypothetical protein WJ60_12150 [Burkholderia ubonensis]|nr:hypothetical protein WJ60_12150 [Burkholderia ubonensis]KVX82492.1 hypothetical protein WL08_09720 [Burkholderia ubonensis]
MAGSPRLVHHAALVAGTDATAASAPGRSLHRAGAAGNAGGGGGLIEQALSSSDRPGITHALAERVKESI